MPKGSLLDSCLLRAKGISKKYPLHKNKDLPGNPTANFFWALKNISFSVERGQTLGIIGPNGAGKSTLLKILSELIPPSEGTVEINGTILSILDIGTGFHPDLSGYENIFFNGSLLGLKKSQINERLEDIIDFSGIRPFIHEPVKTYSSGMYLRLAMSIALYTNSDILLFDEVASVGDAEFSMKAFQKVRELVSQGCACIMISHNLSSVLSLCDSCIFIENGEIAFYGRSKEAVETYLEKVYFNARKNRPASLEHPKCRFISFASLKKSFAMDEPVLLKVLYEIKVPEAIDIVVEVRNFNNTLLSDCEIYRPDYMPPQREPGIYETTCTIPANLFNEGNYSVDLIFGDKVSRLVTVQSVGRFAVTLPAWEASKKWNEGEDRIPFRPRCTWETKRT